MAVLAVSFLLALGTSLMLIRSATRHGHRSADSDLSGPQKFHTRPVPRIGGVAVFSALLGGTGLAMLLDIVDAAVALKLLLCCLPTFGFGLAEDLTKSVSPRRRLFFT